MNDLRRRDGSPKIKGNIPTYAALHSGANVLKALHQHIPHTAEHRVSFSPSPKPNQNCSMGPHSPTQPVKKRFPSKVQTEAEGNKQTHYVGVKLARSVAVAFLSLVYDKVNR